MFRIKILPEHSFLPHNNLARDFISLSQIDLISLPLFDSTKQVDLTQKL